MVRGNQVIFTRPAAANRSLGTGILTVTNTAIRIEGNLVMGWDTGISGRGAATVSKNQVIDNFFGIHATGGNVVGNVVTGNIAGIFVTGTATVMSNAAYMNYSLGFRVQAPFSGVFTKNNMFGNGQGPNCGLFNNGVAGLVATNNYWGVPTGPGPAPADNACADPVDVTPFATKPFTVKPLRP